jgi:hypothetical protein
MNWEWAQAVPGELELASIGDTGEDGDVEEPRVMAESDDVIGEGSFVTGAGITKSSVALSMCETLLLTCS